MRPVHGFLSLAFLSGYMPLAINSQNKTKKKEMGIRFAQHIGIDYHFDQGAHFEWPHYMLVTKLKADCDYDPTKNRMIHLNFKCLRPRSIHHDFSVFFLFSQTSTATQLSLYNFQEANEPNTFFVSV